MSDDTTALNNKSIKIINKTLSTLNSEIERNKERLIYIREGRIFLWKRNLNSAAAIPSFSSESITQIDDCISDLSSYNIQDNDTDFKDEHFKVVISSLVRKSKATAFKGIISSEKSRNEERAHLICQRCTLGNMTNQCQLERRSDIKAAIASSSSVIPMQINVPISDFQDDQFSMLAPLAESALKIDDCESSSTRKTKLKTESTISNAVINSGIPPMRTSAPDLDVMLTTSGNHDTDNLDDELDVLVPITYVDVESSIANEIYQEPQTIIETQMKTPSCALPRHLRMGLTLPNIQMLLDNLPKDVVKACNDQIPTNGEGIRNFPLNDCVNGFVNQHCIIEWARADSMSVCERLMNDPDMAVGVGDANIFVSWTLSTGIQALFDALREFLDVKNLSEISTFS